MLCVSHLLQHSTPCRVMYTYLTFLEYYAHLMAAVIPTRVAGKREGKVLGARMEKDDLAALTGLTGQVGFSGKKGMEKRPNLLLWPEENPSARGH